MLVPGSPAEDVEALTEQLAAGLHGKTDMIKYYRHKHTQIVQDLHST